MRAEVAGTRGERKLERETRPVVVGVDARPVSRRALAIALREAALRRRPLKVVTAWQFPASAGAAMAAVASEPDLEAAARGVQNEVLASVLAGRAPEVPLERCVVEGWAGRAIVDIAGDADLVVVGTRGHRALANLVLGSVSRYVAGHARCPVLIVHADPTDPTDDLARPEPPGELVSLTEEECLGLLAGARVGRVALIHGGRPEIYPVNYGLVGRTIVVRSNPGTKLDGTPLSPVAFEVDELDPTRHRGWSVHVSGIGHEVTGGLDQWSTAARGVDVEHWSVGTWEHVLAIADPVITGRRLVDPLPDAGARTVGSTDVT